MTRINLVPPSELSRLHLIAEYRELPRIFGLADKAMKRGEKPDDKRNPQAYALGSGHCRFFYPRLRFLQIRQYQLIREMLTRGMNPLFTDVPGPETFGHDHVWWKNYEPTPEALALNRARILERTPHAARLPTARVPDAWRREAAGVDHP